MLSLEEIYQYLPKYLSENSQNKLIKDINKFRTRAEGQFYTSRLKEQELIFQGDGLTNLPIINLPDNTLLSGQSIIISNTCDLDSNNRRLYYPNISYAPLIKLDKYISSLKTRKVPTEEIDGHISSIKKQHISNMFYLPKEGVLEYEAVALLDRMISCNIISIQPKEMKNYKLFTLSDFGFYLFVFKLSIHFTRIREKVDRNEGNVILGAI